MVMGIAAEGAQFKVCGSSHELGVEVQGVDASRPLTAAEVRCLRDALNRHAVIYVRNQKLSDAQFAAFCRQFGELKISNLGRFLVPGLPELNIVSNIKENGQHIGNPDAGVLWHSDSAYIAKPDVYTFLYSIEVPSDGGKPLGATSFADTAAAYEALSPKMKDRLKGLQAVQDLRHQEEQKKAVGQYRRGGITAHQERIGLAATHPVVRVHPETGRKSLFISVGHTSHIVGLPEEESEALLRELNAHIEQPQFVYRHEWRVGDILMWDNISVVHKADFDYTPDQRRMMRRASTVGEASIAA